MSGLRSLIPTRSRPTNESGLALVVGNSIIPSSVPDDRTAHGYLRVAAHLLLASQRAGIRTIGVFGAPPVEARTSAAINLAASLGSAQGREGRVVLLDGDLRERTLSGLFGGGALSEPTLLATSLEGVDYLSVPDLGGRPMIRAPSAWRNTFESLSPHYAQIVIDCPSLLDDAEAAVLKESVDAIVLVVQSGRTTKEMLDRALGSAACRVIGVILNGSTDVESPAAGRGW